MAWMESGTSASAPSPRSAQQADELLGVQRLPPARSRSCCLVSSGSIDRFSRRVTSWLVSVSLSGARLIRWALRALAPKVGVTLEQLGSGSAYQEERHALDPVGQLLEECEQGVVRPVEVLEHQHDRPLGGKVLAGTAATRRTTPRGQRGRPTPTSGASRGEQPPRSGIVGSDLACELGCGFAGGVRLEDPALGLDDLAERPERDAVAVREASSLAPAHELAASLDVAAGARRTSRLLPTPGSPMTVTSWTRPASRLARTPRQQRQLELPADQGRVGRRGSRRTPRRARGRERPPDGERLRLALDRDGSSPSYSKTRDRRAIGLLGRPRRRPPGRRPAGARRCSPRRRSTIPRPSRARRRGHDGLAGVDADPHLQSERRIGRVQLVDRLERSGRPARTARSGVVLVGHAAPRRPP